MSSPYLFVYDIPEDSDFANPSSFLRRIGFRVNLSCWVIQEDDTPYGLLRRMDKFHVRWHMVKFDVGENEKLVKLAVESLRKDIHDAVQRGLESSVRANVALDDGEATPADAVAKHKSKCVAIAKRLGTVFNDLRHAASRFGVAPAQLRLADAEQQVTAIRTTMQERCKVWLEAVAELEDNVGSTDPMVQAVKAGGVPAGILADYMDDRGLKKAAKIRQTFSMF